MKYNHGAGADSPAFTMVSEQHQPAATTTPASTLGDRMQSAGTGITPPTDSEETFSIEEEEIELPGEVIPGRGTAGEGFRLSNTADQMPALIAGLRRWKGMTQTQLGEAIGYPAQVIGNIEQGSRKLGLKTLGDLFTALGGELHIEFREKL
ncbi:helix-turn-helix transcriptional regulator [Fibrella sp. HMF5335]|uniref:Helix-turn-helix transcriptional regulator n=1 Tax=Fibrella rubiginis TaxID=2817060 RepID=A0A939GII2_9BACT|nr:helix-turn-helix transcriptional regulator [Fibrella rubiginis]MBO0937859.1 helix-turn-helix transcriptional regulator [Fibrella rubiginis]